jgi:hypothetical protein
MLVFLAAIRELRHPDGVSLVQLGHFQEKNESKPQPVETPQLSDLYNKPIGLV